ncbi:glycosyltransferase family 4 protein [Curtobacterium sp. VKM Ac-2887]|uniref:glycosyltransferase family 4 protein n=1 Tax=Curtobacterium sp. VKM Ac-2887 TaxID=2783819 RepID=UPI00188CE498|nr:glycosyltransferase family 4 protein [Curtobacterium sp. VKM Ac-2887]MBF4584909.1 glycosyltransferase family 4 protein [Curtobacterium sp. VKM Ac-2887]
MAQIVIVQPYVPAYRSALFSELGRRLRSNGHELVIVSGEPDFEQRERQDSVELSDVRQRIFKTKSLKLGPATIRTAPAPSAWATADAVVVELAAGAIYSYRALLGSTPTAVWGHVGSYVNRDSFASRTLRAWQVRRADAVLAYTPSGGEIAVAFGADPAKVSVLGNTSDTVALRRAVLAAREQSEEDARAEIGIGDGPYFAVVGGLDASKRVDLVASTLDVLWDRRSPARFVVAGRGHLEHLLDPAVEREQAHSIGYAGEREKALMARLCVGIFNPGRVGLISPESFALGLPIVTAGFAFHAPEFEYLRPGVDSIVTNDSPEALAAALDELVARPDEAGRLARAAESRIGEYKLEDMVDRMQQSIEQLLRRSPSASTA